VTRFGIRGGIAVAGSLVSGGMSSGAAASGGAGFKLMAAIGVRLNTCGVLFTGIGLGAVFAGGSCDGESGAGSGVRETSRGRGSAGERGSFSGVGRLTGCLD
jgi:hypothetical protein